MDNKTKPDFSKFDTETQEEKEAALIKFNKTQRVRDIAIGIIKPILKMLLILIGAAALLGIVVLISGIPRSIDKQFDAVLYRLSDDTYMEHTKISVKGKFYNPLFSDPKFSGKIVVDHYDFTKNYDLFDVSMYNGSGKDGGGILQYHANLKGKPVQQPLGMFKMTTLFETITILVFEPYEGGGWSTKDLFVAAPAKTREEALQITRQTYGDEVINAIKEMANMPMIHTYKPTDRVVKPIGRIYEGDDTLWFAQSGSGVEFSFHGRKAEITLCSDSIPSSKDNFARIGFEVNGERVFDDLLDKSQKTYTVFDNETEQDVTIKVIKLSEAAMSIAGIKEILIESSGMIHPTSASKRKIEFIGDSITAGYGVDDENRDHHFSTATEDVTKTYAYKTAVALQADYSIVAYSGYGIISGYSGNGQKVPSQLVPKYYDKVGKDAVTWDFKNFEPDLVVINLGTNDDSYAQDDMNKQEEFAQEYMAFLKQVRSHNVDSTILCTLGIMGDRLYPSVVKAVADYAMETGDVNIKTMKFNTQLESDGFAADWHPTEVTHTKAADKLIAHLKELMNW